MDNPIQKHGYLRYLIQAGWQVYPACEIHEVVKIPRIVGDLMARTPGDAQLALRATSPGDDEVFACPIVGEIQSLPEGYTAQQPPEFPYERIKRFAREN